MRRECPRKYWYRYVGHWNGWLESAAAEARTAWHAGKKESLSTWLGKRVHQGIATYLAGPEDIESIIARQEARMREEFDSSRRGTIDGADPRAFALIEHYLREPLPDDVLENQVDQLAECLRALAQPSADGFDPRALIAEAKRHGRFFAVERPDPDRDMLSFALPELGLPLAVYAMPDFLLDTGEHLLLIDWKTGHGPTACSEALSDQLRIYALRLEHSERRAAWSGRTIEAYEFHLPRRVWSGRAVDAADREGATLMLRNATSELLSLRGDTPSIPKAAMPAKPDQVVCGNCSFRGFCPDRSPASR